MKKLCFGTYLSVLCACIPKKGTKLQTPQKKLVGIILMSVDNTYDITDDDYTTSRLASCDNPLPSNITEGAAAKLSDTDSVVRYFKDKVVPLLSRNMDKLAILAIRDIIYEDEIDGGTIVELIGNKTKKALLSQDIAVASGEWIDFYAHFLAGIFLYTATAVSNKDGKRCVDEITDEYVCGFKNKADTIKIDSEQDENDDDFNKKQKRMTVDNRGANIEKQVNLTIETMTGDLHL